MDQEKYYPSCHKSWVFHFQWVTLLPVYIRVPQLHLKSKIKHPLKSFNFEDNLVDLYKFKQIPASAPLGFLWVARWDSSCSIP